MVFMKDSEKIARDAVELATQWQNRANALQARQEKTRHAKLARLNRYLADLKNPAIEYVSVKISTLFSQINPLAFDYGVSILTQRLSELYRAADSYKYARNDGTRISKFVNLDMEAYRDLAMTAEAFIHTLDQQEFKHTSAGMALQAYLPDSYHILKDITAWARRRVAAGGSPVKVRIVKGANMEMERFESAIFDWPLAPFDTKLETDANWKRMVEFAMQPDNIKAVRLGVASHNLLDLAYAYLIGQANGVMDYFTFEMIEGMANHVRRTIQETGQELIVYVPVAGKDQFLNAIAYLIRRLDENTGPKNFLRHLNHLKTRSRSWDFLTRHFRSSIKQQAQPPKNPHRTQNRISETFPEKMGTYYDAEFRNEPNTDWSLADNRRWAEAIRNKWEKGPEDSAVEIPLVVAGHEIFKDRRKKELRDPSQFNQPVVVAISALANGKDIDRAVSTAKADPDGWRRKTHRQRHRGDGPGVISSALQRPIPARCLPRPMWKSQRRLILPNTIPTQRPHFSNWTTSAAAAKAWAWSSPPGISPLPSPAAVSWPPWQPAIP